MNNTGIDAELAQIEQIYILLIDFMFEYSIQLLAALFIFLVGLWLASKAAAIVDRLLVRHKVDVTLASFATNLVKITIIIMVGIISLGKLGISVTPFVAAIGAASLGAGLALQGMLSNYAAGVTIIVMRPFVVGNTITVDGVSGVVEQIHLGMTKLSNEDGEEITIPNKHIIGEIYLNSFENTLVETIIGIEYSADPEKAIEVLGKALEGIDGIAQQPAAQIGIDNFGDSAINLGVRFWVKTRCFYSTKYQTNLALFQALKEAGINIPFPQRVVHLEKSEG